jgi:hypothetical protein
MFSGRRSYTTADTHAFHHRLKEAVQCCRHIARIQKNLRFVMLFHPMCSSKSKADFLNAVSRWLKNTVSRWEKPKPGEQKMTVSRLVDQIVQAEIDRRQSPKEGPNDRSR